MNEDRFSSEQDERSWLDKITHLFSSEPRTRADLEDVLSIAADNEVIDQDARSIIEGAMQVSDMQARDIMIPRSQMVVIKAEQTLEEILPQIIRAAHSRYPVIGDSNDDVLGILLAKDLLPLALNTAADKFKIKDVIRPATFVPESKRLNVLLREFRETRQHMAIVIDEYGSVCGAVTIEDVLEQIVGEIEDEYDVDDDSYIKKFDEQNHIVKALTPVDEFNEYFSTDFSDQEFTTVGGLILQQFGHIPERGETIRIGPFLITILNADSRQIKLIKVTSTAISEPG